MRRILKSAPRPCRSRPTGTFLLYGEGKSPRPTLWLLFTTFFRIGLFTVGGGYAMLALVRKIIVNDRHWIDEDEFVETIAVMQSLPGIFAVNTALSVGNRVKGKGGSIVAALGAVLPSIAIVLALAIFAQSAKSNPVVESCFKGIRPCVVALILSPALQMVRKAGITWRNFYLPVAATVLVCAAGVSPVWVILAAGLLGAAHGYYLKRKGGAA
ncbi:MAG: chromate transporter [Bacteroides sp.]|nr:chromate transporter [Ruminococcus flavefaciens]MCM1555544.1 chromate transporter [Bacteroides sp.]